MQSIKDTLEHLSHVSSSGIDHPYYAFTTPPVISEPEAMFASVISDPPLGHETVVLHGEQTVTFNVLLEADALDDSWEVQLWRSGLDEASEWQATPLSVCASRKNFGGDSKSASVPLRSARWYTTVVHRPSSSAQSINFTIRFRPNFDDPWKWVQSRGGGDGLVIFQAPLDTSQGLSYYINNIDPRIQVRSVQSEVPETLLWCLTAPANRSKGDKSGYSKYTLGLPLHFVRWFALVRLWSPWLAPRQGTGLPLAEKDAVLYSFLRKDGLHVVLLAISGIDDVLSILKYEHSSVVIEARNDREEEGVFRIVISVGKTFECACACAVYCAREIVTQNSMIARSDVQGIIGKEENKMESKPSSKKEEDIKANWVENWYDGFTYCTWNGLGQRLTEEKILGALESLEKNNIKITNLIIDDNWQSLDHEGESQMVRGWKEFEANREGFPSGLKHAISSIRRKYPGINHIAVWHALLGYWGGISPNGKITREYKTLEITKRSNVVGGKMLVVDANDVPRFYDDFYRFLVSTGIDSVKTDAQFFLDEIDTAPARRALTTTYLDAWTTAQLRHFAGNAISCMSQTPPILFHSQLPTNMPAIPVRNSDDFFPEVEASHSWHVFCNAHNSLLTKHLNVLPDWDMFQTSHKWAKFHAAARCVSGGPIYVTDAPGQHDVALIKQMTAQTIRGQTVILRPSVVGRSTQMYIGYEENRLCKVGAYNGQAGTGSSFMGIFNCRPTAIREVVPLSEFPGTDSGEYVVRSHGSGEVSDAMSAHDGGAVVGMEIAGFGSDVFCACPVATVELSHSSTTSQPSESGNKSPFKTANLGLLSKMTGPVAILSSTTHLDQTPSGKYRVRIRTSLKALGVWGLWIERLETLDIKADFLVLLEGKVVPFECVTTEERVLQVDVERAWRELGCDAGWGNEVAVEVFVSVR